MTWKGISAVMLFIAAPMAQEMYDLPPGMTLPIELPY
jgi:hypothetical protein